MRVVIWANFDVDYDIGIPDRWREVRSTAGPAAILRVKRAVGTLEKQRSRELQFDHTASQTISVVKRESVSYKSLTSSRFPLLDYAIEAVLEQC